jgi:DNA-binding MarR family transcriptional regulator
VTRAKQTRPTVGKTTVQRLEQRGFIRRLGHQDNSDCDDYELTPLGQHHIGANRQRYNELLLMRINASIDFPR